MSLTTEALRKLVEFGMTADQILAVAEAMGEAPARSKGAERQARYRERQARNNDGDVTRDVTGDASLSPLPLPSSPQTPQQPTPTPEKTTRPRKAEPDPVAEAVWQAANQTSRDRSGRPKAAKAVAEAVRSGATQAAIVASVKAICGKQGDFAQGLHLIVAGEHWRDHLTGARPTTAGPAPPEVQARRARHFAQTGEWREDWGPRPANDHHEEAA